MFRQLHRRRLLFGAAFFTMAIARAYLPYLRGLAQPDTPPLQMAHSPAFTFAILFLGLHLLCAAFVLPLPALHREIEVIALAALLSPAAIDLLGVSSPFARLLLFFTLACLIVGVFNGFVLDSWRLRTRSGASHRFVPPLAPDAVWRALVPGEGPLEAYWQPNLMEQRPVPGHRDQIEQPFALGDGLFLHRKVRFPERLRPHRCHLEAVEDASNRVLRCSPGSTVLSETRSITCAQDGRRTGLVHAGPDLQVDGETDLKPARTGRRFSLRGREYPPRPVAHGSGR